VNRTIERLVLLLLNARLFVGLLILTTYLDVHVYTHSTILGEGVTTEVRFEGCRAAPIRSKTVIERILSYHQSIQDEGFGFGIRRCNV